MKINRRQFLKGSAVAAGLVAVGGGALYLRSKGGGDLLDDIAEATGKVYAARFGKDSAAALLEETWQAYEDIELPYIGGEQNLNTGNLTYAAYMLGMYKALKPHGHEIEEVGRMIYEIYETLADYPQWLLSLIGRFKYNRSYEMTLQEEAARSQKRQYPEDWVLTYIEGDGENFDYGIDITECGICKLYHAQDADALTPYMCLSDEVISRAFNRGLVRYHTLAEGGNKCDFRYKRGRETFIYPLRDGWPPKFRNLERGLK